MKRDMEFIREILQEAEKLPPFSSTPSTGFEFEGRDRDFIDAHVVLLIEAGLLRGHNSSVSTGTRDIKVYGVGWDGHEFLAATDDPTTWARVKKLTGLPFRVLLDVAVGLATEVAKKQVGLA